LRQRYGYRGELRAAGDVLHDQIVLMQRQGFDSFAVSHPGTIRALAEKRIVTVPTRADYLSGVAAAAE
jgi:phosphoadenosine phosphosulfate reductase